jgi:cell division protein ZapA (FtsZ GTPase activity inhibitor)
MGTTHTTKVSILGSEYTLRGSVGPERITEVAQYVDGKLRLARSKSDHPSDLAKVAILTSLNIAYELFAAREDAKALSEARDRMAELADQLEACVEPEQPDSVGLEAG